MHPYWTLQEIPAPSAEESKLEGVSCTSSTTCNAVGWFWLTRGERSATGRDLEWHGMEIAGPPIPTGATVSALHAISCTSSTACTGVGQYESGTNTSMFAERWNGTEWKLQELPSPEGAFSSELFGVSCTSATACTAVGEFHGSGSYGASGTYPLVESWNGTEWKVQEAPSPISPGLDILEGVSCTSSTACTAVGYYWTAESQPLVEHWNGTEWKLQEVPIPAQAKVIHLHGVSCTSSTACIAGGWFRNSSEQVRPLIESWNGTEWAFQEPPHPTGTKSSPIGGVSCTSSTSCSAAGSFANPANETVPMAESWNGTEWKLQEPPRPVGGTGSLFGVSCSLATVCTGVGDGSSKPLAERYE